MIGIYKDGFLEYLEENLGKPKVNVKNIICKCPWCDVGRTTSKDHLWISVEAPIFNCFRAGCKQSGVVSKLLSKIEGRDSSGKYVDQSMIRSFAKKQLKLKKSIFRPRRFILPDLQENIFQAKALYTRQRFKFAKPHLKTIKGLIFDINRFFEMNGIELSEKEEGMKQYFHTNFVGFISEYHTNLVLRNVDKKSGFRYYRMKIQQYPLTDYYKIDTGNHLSTHVVLAEGIYDISTEHIFDSLGLKHEVRLYAATISSSYLSLLKSIAFHEQIFRQDVHILSDDDVDLSYYRKLKYYNKHLINTLTVYYNRSGKDFNVTPIVVDKQIL